MNWYRLAKYCDKTYNTYVDFDEEFFVCPECDEPIYSDDWREADFTLGRMYTGKCYCPVCENLLYEEEKE